jgi:hypothetical protein
MEALDLEAIMKFTRLFSITLGLVLTTSLSFAGDVIPNCIAAGQTLNLNNEQAVTWKNTTANQFHSRAHIKGKLVTVYPDHSGHHHMEVLIGPNNQDTIEVIYNEAFGPMPTLNPGAIIEACGDFITSKAQSGPYPASPDGAIVHWVHKAPNSGHESGYVVVDGTVCGQNSGSVSPKPPRHGKQPKQPTPPATFLE